MQIAVATDFVTSTGSPQPWLKAIAEAGFTHLHWCHQWCTDYLYGKYELAQIKKWLKEYGLTLMDIHGSAGTEKCYCSAEEYMRKEGVDLVRNRIEMLSELEGTGVLMMHIPHRKAAGNAPDLPECLIAMRRSLDELVPYLEKHHILLAVENMWADNFEVIREVLNEYPEHLIGLCYDSGHANDPALYGMDHLYDLRYRLQALHLHDNDGTGDQHQPPFYGNVDWERLAGIIADSSYKNPVSFEMSMRNTPFFDTEKDPREQTPDSIQAYLKDAYSRCEKFCRMVEDKQK